MRRSFLKYFAFFFLAFLLVFNWEKVSFLFNYEVISHFLTKPFKTIAKNKGEEKVIFKPQVLEEEKKCEKTEKADSIEISALNVLAPLVFVENEKEVRRGLNLGVVHFPGSGLPGEEDTIILEGHSAPPGWPKIKYDWVFSNLSQLNVGDKIILNFENCKFHYKVKEGKILKRGEDIPKEWQEKDGEKLILISCWPPGKDIKRIAILAEREK